MTDTNRIQEIDDKTCSYGLCYNRKERKEDRYCKECQKALWKQNKRYGEIEGL